MSAEIPEKAEDVDAWVKRHASPGDAQAGPGELSEAVRRAWESCLRAAAEEMLAGRRG
jgi:hypothetical protein